MKRCPAYTESLSRLPASSSHGGIEMAVRIAKTFSHTNPTPRALQQRFGMSRATAYRWVAAFKNANPIPEAFAP